MSSNIDATKPTTGNAFTSDVRANFLSAKNEIEALQAKLLGYSARKLNDQSVASSTALMNETDLYVLIGANEKWNITWFLSIGALLSTTGIKVAVTTPAAAVQEIIAHLAGDTITAGNKPVKRSTASGTALDFTAATQVGVSDGFLVVATSIQNSTTAGSAQLQFAQSTSNATAITIRKQSYVDAQRVA